jgi:hypothetical protein
VIIQSFCVFERKRVVKRGEEGSSFSLLNLNIVSVKTVSKYLPSHLKIFKTEKNLGWLI